MVAATVGRTSSRSVTPASGTQKTPSGNPSATSAASCSASRGPGRGARVEKGDEERVALRVDFASPLAGARAPQDPPVLGERLHVARAQVLEKPRRAFDVREEERDGAGGKLTHPAIMRQ